MLKVNLACGNTFVCGDNWLNVDYSSFNSSVLQANILSRLPINNNSAELVYSSHFLEHIPRDKVDSFLLECWRILKPGGVLRLVVPDLENLCRIYLYHRDQCEHEKADFVVLELLDQCVRSSSGGELGRYYNYLNAKSMDNENMIFFVRERTGENLVSPPPPRAQLACDSAPATSLYRTPLDPGCDHVVAQRFSAAKREPGRRRRTPSLALRQPSAPAVVDCQQLRGHSALYCGHQPLRQLSLPAARPSCRWPTPQGSGIHVYRSAEAPVALSPWGGRHG